MTIKTFWTIFIKILGIWLVIGSLGIISPSLAVLLNYPNDSGQSIAIVIMILLFTIGLYIFVLWLFVFKTAWLIKVLHLDKGFAEEEFDLTIQSSSILSIAIIVIGGLMFIDSLPELCRRAFMYFKLQGLYQENSAVGWVAFFFVKTILGYLIMTNSKPIVAFISKQTSKEEGNDE